jgi:hypothetical protein
MRYTAKNKVQIEELFQNVHGDKYDYSRAHYNGVNSKIEIICPSHGSFWQTPSHHLHREQGCPSCANEDKRLSYDTFLSRAYKAHGHKYTYDKATYKNSYSKMEINCQVHGSFWQRPSDHLLGKGCKECADYARRKSFDEFSKEALDIHGDKYNYSNTKWEKSSDNKIEIICPLHGSFWQTPHNHIVNRQGCPICASNKRTMDTAEFIAKASYIHEDKYDYSLANYVGTRTPVEILCRKHGTFWQIPNNHLMGQGCPFCADASFKMDRPAIVYYLEILGGIAYKIGITGRTVHERYNKTDLERIRILWTLKFELGSDAYLVEQGILNDFSEFLYDGLPLLSSGNTELFKIDISHLLSS